MREEPLSEWELRRLAGLAIQMRGMTRQQSRQKIASKILEAIEEGLQEELLLAFVGILESEEHADSGRSLFPEGYNEHRR